MSWETFAVAPSERKERKEKLSTALLQMCEDFGVTAFRDTLGRVLVRFPRGGHWELVPVGSDAFRRWITAVYFEQEEAAPSAGALDELELLLGAKTDAAPPRESFVRIGWTDDDRVFLDMGTQGWNSIEVSAAGWTLQEDHALPFLRPTTQREMTVPERGGSLELLRPFVNSDDGGFRRVVGWLISCWMPKGPYPVLALRGEQGSAKSTLSEMLKRIIDPTTPALRAMPQDEASVLVSAQNQHVSVFDNVSALSHDMSDTLCRMATGGGLVRRKLYTDGEEAVLDVCRPVILNGIGGSWLDRPDLLSRSIVVQLEPIEEQDRKPAAEIEARFRTVLPKIQGALLDAVSDALRHSHDAPSDSLERMADAHKFVLAAELGGRLPWRCGEYTQALTQGRRVAELDALEDDGVAVRLRDLAAESWSGTPSNLLLKINGNASLAEQRYLPQSSKALSSHIERLTPMLRRHGVAVEKEKTRAGRLYRLWLLASDENFRPGGTVAI